MKKSLFLLGMAVAALTSCTNSEVMDIAEGQAIGFTSFVNNGTRADITDTEFSKFWVYGALQQANSASYGSVFDNVEVTGSGGTGAANTKTWTYTGTKYWIPKVTYQFAAYADGLSKITSPNFDAAKKTLTFTDYTAGTNDLVAAVAPDKTYTSGEATPVAFSFKHMLSKVKFTFTSTASADQYTIKVSNLKFSAIKSSTGSIAPEQPGVGQKITWTSSQAPADYTYKLIDDVAVVGGSVATEDLYVIPQDNTNLTASFTVEIYDVNYSTTTAIETKTYSNVSLAYTPASVGAAGTANTWEPGYYYNYQAELNPNLKPIQFTVTAVESWQEGNSQAVTPSLQ